LDEKMRAAAQAAQHRLTFAGLEVEGDAALVAVVGPPVQRVIRVRLIFIEGAESAGRRTARRFELGHIRAEVGEDLSAEQPALGRKVEDTIGAKHRPPPTEKKGDEGEKRASFFSPLEFVSLP